MNGKKQKMCLKTEEVLFGIDADNPWEYYGTDDINQIPKHLRKRALEIKPMMIR